MELIKNSQLKNMKILREDMEIKQLVVYAEHKENNNPAILIFNKCCFPVTIVPEIVTDSLDTKNVPDKQKTATIDKVLMKLVNSEDTNSIKLRKTDHVNDIWHTYKIFIKDEEINETKVTIIYPATEKLIKKYTACKKVCVEETAELYKNVTTKFIEKSQHSNEWIYNIQNGLAEKDRLLFIDKDPEIGFSLLPSMSWAGDVEQLYLNTLVQRRDLLSVRDLRKIHIPLLEYMLEETCKVCKKRFDLNKSDLRIYFHYLPSFYHLHLHVTNFNFVPGGCQVGKAILLRDVIDNLKLDDLYYAKKTLTITLSEQDKLLELIRIEELNSIEESKSIEHKKPNGGFLNSNEPKKQKLENSGN